MSSGAKGRLVPPRRTKKLSVKEQEKVREANALKAAKEKLGLDKVAELKMR